MDGTGVSGRVIAGRYRMTAQLGQGGMGSVWRADDLTLHSPVAIKLIDQSLADDGGVRARFYQEARAAAALRSPHVVQILDHGVDDGTPFIAMELLDGESLAARLARVRTLPWADAERIFADVARAVRRAHEAGIVHRDLKPDNVFLVHNDDREIAKVLDFGIAKVVTASGAEPGKTTAGALIGTPPYMSPEQARGAAVDFRTDLWALGVIAFECVCGRLPFTAEAHGELVLQICAHPIPVPSEIAEVPPGFDAWMERALARDPAERFPSARAMAEALRPILVPSSEPVSPPRPAPTARVAAALSFAAFALAVVIVIQLFGNRSEPARAVDAGTPVMAALSATAAAPAPPVSASSEEPAPPPVRTASPRPVEKATPRPVETATPRAVETAAPRPIETAAPRPIETAAPRPVETATPPPAEPAPKSKDRLGF